MSENAQKVPRQVVWDVRKSLPSVQHTVIPFVLMWSLESAILPSKIRREFRKVRLSPYRSGYPFDWAMTASVGALVVFGRELSHKLSRHIYFLFKLQLGSNGF
jgi:hypothetical protein